jgi:AcrR family transcriptional regulator
MAPRTAPTIGRQRQTRRTEETRDVVLDAAEECFARFGVAQTTIDDVVRVAKVPRATLYRHAGGKDDLVAAVAMRRFDEFLAKLARHVAKFDNVADVLVEGTMFTVDHHRSNDLLARLLAPESIPHGPRLIEDTMAEARDRMVVYVTPMVEAGHRSGEIRPEVTPQDAAEWLTRVIASLLVMRSPWNRTKAKQRAFLRRMLVPAFVPDTVR